MTRVGFVLAGAGTGWLGGISYFRNLFAALASLPGRPLDPVVVVPSRDAERIRGLVGERTVAATRLVQGRSMPWIARQLALKTSGTDLLLTRWLRSEGISALSHSGHLGRSSVIPALAWLPDFQHRHMPQFFSRSELERRDRGFRAVCSRATRVIVSSEVARRDLVRFAPEAEAKARVLRFVDCSAASDTMVSLEDLERRYGFEGPYVLLPNQFWVHKNHRIVIEALALLRATGRRIRVLATGNTVDPRRPGHYAELMRLRAERGVEEEFRVIGLVPFGDLAALMRNAVGVLNPSLYEGWSTSVEEAKSLGKLVILSDIPVHREQAPEHAVYFDPLDAGALAEALWRSARDPDPEVARERERDARDRLPARRLAFARTYESIVREVVR